MAEINGLRGNLLRESLAAATRSRTGGLEQSAADPSKTFERLVEQVTQGIEGISSSERPKGEGLVEMLRDGLGAVQGEVGARDALPEQLVTGQLESFEQLASQVKRADLTFRFSLEIRNRLVDAYREVMRMTV